jgi:hypothetical protein
MSLQTKTTPTEENVANKRKRKNYEDKYNYNGAELLGYTDKSGKYYSPHDMWFNLNEYESILRDEQLDKASYIFVRAIENKRGYPEGWLNLVLSKIITTSKNGLAERLVKEFRDRGYSDAWLEKAQ